MTICPRDFLVPLRRQPGWVDDTAVRLRKGCDLAHLERAQLEIEQRQILREAARVGRAGQRDHLALLDGQRSTTCAMLRPCAAAIWRKVGSEKTLPTAIPQ